MKRWWTPLAKPTMAVLTREEKALPGEEMEQSQDPALHQQAEGGQQNQGRQTLFIWAARAWVMSITPG